MGACIPAPHVFQLIKKKKENVPRKPQNNIKLCKRSPIYTPIPRHRHTKIAAQHHQTSSTF